MYAIIGTRPASFTAVAASAFTDILERLRSLRSDARERACLSLTHATEAPEPLLGLRRRFSPGGRRLSARPEAAERQGIACRTARSLPVFVGAALVLLALALSPAAHAQDTLTVPTAPQDLEATVSDGRVDLNWSAPSDDGGSDLVRYEARHAQGASVPENTKWRKLGLGTDFHFVSLDNNQLYSFEVRAVNGRGAGPVAQVQATPAPMPTAPQELSATSGDAEVVLNWSAPANDYGSAIVRYEVRHAAGASVPAETAWTSIGLATTHSITGLGNGTTYSFEVRAVNGQGPGPAAQVQATPATVPTAPQELRATTSDQQVNLTWSAPANDGGSALLRYEARSAKGASVPGNTAWLELELYRNFFFGNLDNNQLYSFEVRAVNERGSGPAAQVQATPTDPGVTISAVDATVTEGSDAEFVVRRTGSTRRALQFNLNVSGHNKIMSSSTRTIVASHHTVVATFERGQSEVNVSYSTEADRVNEGDGEISVTILASPDYEVGGTGTATVLVEDDDIPEVTLRWTSPAMTLENNVWVGSMVEGEEIRYEVECSGNTQFPELSPSNTVGTASTSQRFVARKQEIMNHPVQQFPDDVDHYRLHCADPTNRYAVHFSGVRDRYTGPSNGEIRVDLLPQQLQVGHHAFYQCFLDSAPGAPEDVRFCPKYTLGAATSARIEVLNRNPTITVEAIDDEVSEGEPARFRLTRIWTSDWLKPASLLGASTTVDFGTSATGNYVESPPSGQKTFGATETEIIVEVPTVKDDVPGENGLVTLELLGGSTETQETNFGGHYEVYDHLDGITPPGKNSRVASVRVLNESRGVAVTPTAATVPEGMTRTYTVALESQPTGPVTVTPSVTGSPDVTVSPSTLTFTATTWNVAQTVTVSAAQDADAGERCGDRVARGVGCGLRVGDGRRRCGDGAGRRKGVDGRGPDGVALQRRRA